MDLENLDRLGAPFYAQSGEFLHLEFVRQLGGHRF
jgi:hypothetical protein